MLCELHLSGGGKRIREIFALFGKEGLDKIVGHCWVD